MTSYHITGTEEIVQFEEDVEEVLPELEEGVKSIVDDLDEVNLGIIDDHRPTYVSALLTPEEKEAYMKILIEYKDVFAWTYKEMPSLYPRIAIHNLAVKHGARPIKQAQRRFRPELVLRIETEDNKLIEVGFIRKVKLPNLDLEYRSLQKE